MAIQKVDVTVPGGDTPRSANIKINANFSDPTHAASKLVGYGPNRVPVYSDSGDGFYSLDGSGFAGTGTKRTFNPDDTLSNAEVLPIAMQGLYQTGSKVYNHSDKNDDIGARFGTVAYFKSQNTWFSISVGHTASNNGIYVTSGYYAGSYITTTQRIYTTANTTKDTATGFLKASSPVLHVYNDSITKIHEAEQLDITVDKKGVGHYEIHGTTGLRKDDGWFMSPPRDVHGNVLCMVDLEEKDGVVILKTYKKLFDFETVAIVHDYDNPMDIPEGVCVEFRFNDLPQEQLDEPIE